MILIILFVLYGVPVVLGLSGTISNWRRSPVNPSVEKPVVPTAPKLSEDMIATSSARAVVRGVSDPKVTIELTQNGQLLTTVETLTDGTFSQDVSLEKGENKFSARAVNPTGEKSEVSNTYVLSYLSAQPKLDVQSPKDGDNTKTSPISISGQTDPGDSVTINDRLAIVNEDGKFNYAINLSNGDNKIKVVASDQAGNQTTKELTIKYQQ